jgi:hypothetical protein
VFAALGEARRAVHLRFDEQSGNCSVPEAGFGKLSGFSSGRISSPLGRPAKQQARQVIATNLREVLLKALNTRGFAKIASFAKNKDIGWSRINFISVLQEEPTRCRISR